MPEKDRYRRRLEMGLCTRCGAPNDRPERVKCSRCAGGTTKEPTPPDERKSSNINVFLDPEQTRVGIVDIETTGLFGDFDIPLAVVIKTYGRDERAVLKIDLSEPDLLSAEEDLLARVKYVLESYDGYITYYGTGFDIPFLRTRWLSMGFDPIGKRLHLDVYYTVKRALRLSRNRLQSVVEMLRFEDKTVPVKGRVDPEHWIRATFGRSTEALEFIIAHCVEDVDALEAVVNKLRVFLPDRVLRR